MPMRRQSTLKQRFFQEYGLLLRFSEAREIGNFSELPVDNNILAESHVFIDGA